MDALDLIDQLEDEVTQGSFRIPLVGKVLVDAQVAQALLERLRRALPADMKAVSEFRKQEHDIVTEAIDAADKIRVAAHRESRARVEESSLVLEAKARGDEVLADARRQAQTVLEAVKGKAKEILSEADQEAEDRRREADDYARKALEDLHRQLRSIEDQVAKGLDVFRATETAGAKR